MVNNTLIAPRDAVDTISRLVRAYVVIAALTVIALAVLSATGSAQATRDAWVHAIVVAVFAVLLPMRWNAARRGDRRALAATGIIAAILTLANLIEAVTPGLFPIWMRVEMVGIAVLMAIVATRIWSVRRPAR